MAAPAYWARDFVPFQAEPLTVDQTADVVVIGGGVTGVAAAYYLAASHGAEVVLLERDQFAGAASGRNAGMVVPTFSKLSVSERIDQWGPERARESGQIANTAVNDLRDLISTEGISCDLVDSGWIQVAHRPELVSRVERTASSYCEDLGIEAIALNRDELAARGLGEGAHCYGGVLVPNAFGVNPAKLVSGLAEAATRHGARLYCDSGVTRIDRGAGATRIAATARASVRAERIVLATDVATPPALVPYVANRLLPTSGAVMVTRPLSDDEWASVAVTKPTLFTDMRRVLFYWRRLPDNRLLFGGRGPGLTARKSHHCSWLHKHMIQRFPALSSLEVESFWTGPIGLTYDRTPHYGAVPDDPAILYGAGYLGTGLALGTAWGRNLAALAAPGSRSVEPRSDEQAPWTRDLATFPLGPLRRYYFHLARFGYEVLDRRRP